MVVLLPEQENMSDAALRSAPQARVVFSVTKLSSELMVHKARVEWPCLTGQSFSSLPEVNRNRLPRKSHTALL